MKVDWIRIYQVSRFQATAWGRRGNVRYIFLMRFLSPRIVSTSGVILMATQQQPTFSGASDLNPEVHYLALTLPLGILTHIPTRISHLGRVSLRTAASISHGRRMNSLTNAERHFSFRRTPRSYVQHLGFSDICIRTLWVLSTRRPPCYLPIYTISPLTSQYARQTHDFISRGRHDHYSNAMCHVTAYQAMNAIHEFTRDI